MSFDSLLNEAANECLSHLGEKIFIKGVEIEAIFKDESFFDESGRYRQTTISIRKQDAKLFQQNDLLMVRNRQFKVKYIPEIEDSILDLELTNA